MVPPTNWLIALGPSTRLSFASLDFLGGTNWPVLGGTNWPVIAGL